ncbi:MAG TPA: glycosyltransferase family 87 protein, partial [Polyangiaceae bacterium]|nr:glycosyltransferase family 87 protein [Polyangiaceae bacterium]
MRASPSTSTEDQSVETAAGLARRHALQSSAAASEQLHAWLAPFSQPSVRLFASARVKLRAHAGPAVLFAAVVGLLATLSVLQVALESKPHDFLSYYFAAQVASHGANFYDAAVLQSAAAAQSVQERVYPYLYPPFLAHVMRGFAGMKLPHAHALWLLLNISAFVAALTGLLLAAHKTLLKGPSLRENLALLLLTAAVLIAALPLRSNVLFGQVNPLVLMFVCMAVSAHWMGFRTLTGVCLAPAILIKLTPAVLLLFFVARGDRRVVGTCLATLVVLAAMTLPVGAVADW